jgi:hypothetical protein
MGLTLRWIGYNMLIHHTIAKRNKEKCIKIDEKCSNPIYISREGKRYFNGE